MDAFGVPKKINKHVYKALDHYMRNKSGSTFLQIYHFVKNLNRNCKPITNLRGVVKTVLDHFQRTGVIHKDDTNHYRLRCPILFTEMVKMESQPKPDSDPNQANKSIIQPDIPAGSKRRRHSDDSFLSENEATVTRRFHGRKKIMENRKGRKIELPRAKRHRSSNRQSSKKSCSTGPRVISARKIEDHRKTQRGLNFDDCSTGEPGADDRDSGDECYVRSMTSLDRVDVNGQAPDTARRSATSLAEDAMDASFGCLNYGNIQDEASKVNFVRFE